MSTIPHLTYRYAGFTQIYFRNISDVTEFRVSGAYSLDEAFTSPTAMFTVPRGGTYKSKTLRRRGVGTSIYTTKGLTFAQYDLEDFWSAGTNLPHDTDVSYLVVEERNSAGVWRPPGPIFIVPGPAFFTNTRPSLVVAGTAPDVAATVPGTPPAGALRFVLPRFADAASITNNGSASIYIAFGEGQAELEILDGQTTFLPDGAVSEVFIRGSGAAVPFSIFFAIVNAEMA